MKRLLLLFFISGFVLAASHQPGYFFEGKKIENHAARKHCPVPKKGRNK